MTPLIQHHYTSEQARQADLDELGVAKEHNANRIRLGLEQIDEVLAAMEAEFAAEPRKAEAPGTYAVAQSFTPRSPLFPAERPPLDDATQSQVDQVMYGDPMALHKPVSPQEILAHIDAIHDQVSNERQVQPGDAPLQAQNVESKWTTADDDANSRWQLENPEEVTSAQQMVNEATPVPADQLRQSLDDFDVGSMLK